MKKRMLMTKTKKNKNEVEKEESNMDERNVTFFFLTRNDRNFYLN